MPCQATPTGAGKLRECSFIEPSDRDDSVRLANWRWFEIFLLVYFQPATPSNEVDLAVDVHICGAQAVGGEFLKSGARWRKDLSQCPGDVRACFHWPRCCIKRRFFLVPENEERIADGHEVAGDLAPNRMSVSFLYQMPRP